MSHTSGFDKTALTDTPGVRTGCHSSAGLSRKSTAHQEAIQKLHDYMCVVSHTVSPCTFLVLPIPFTPGGSQAIDNTLSVHLALGSRLDISTGISDSLHIWLDALAMLPFALLLSISDFQVQAWLVMSLVDFLSVWLILLHCFSRIVLLFVPGLVLPAVLHW